MARGPILAAKIAELITTAASHMIAPFVLLNNHFTFLTFLKLKLCFQVLDPPLFI